MSDVEMKTKMLFHFERRDTEILSTIIQYYLKEQGIEPLSFAFRIEVDYTEEDES